MDNYKEGTRLDLRFATSRGELTIAQAWTLPIPELDALALELEKAHEASGKKSFVLKKSPKDKVAKLKFDIILDILTTKVEEADAASENAENKRHNAKIDALIAEKEDANLKKKSVADLQKMRRPEN
jgi:hypothetical protein